MRIALYMLMPLIGMSLALGIAIGVGWINAARLADAYSIDSVRQHAMGCLLGQFMLLAGLNFVLVGIWKALRP